MLDNAGASPPNQELHLTGATILGFQGSKLPQAARHVRLSVGRTIREDGDVRKSAHQTCHPFCLEISLECPTLR
ncbi:MAG TPA: hypothetical protein VGX03_33325 [Candidatus Binatia bacterium]|nr:hypothetical protein [Candidatus Binatia bacterium]